jgi:hypothetical protein
VNKTICRGGAAVAAMLALGVARTAHAQDDEPLSVNDWTAPMAVSSAPQPGRVPLQVVGLVVGRYRVPMGRSYRTVTRHVDFCATPCQLFATPGALELYMSGPGIALRAETITVPPAGLRVRFHAPSSTALIGGALLATWGAVASVIGISLGAIGLGAGNEGLELSGGITLGVGTLLLVPSIVLVAAVRWGIAWQGPPAIAAADPARIAASDAPLRSALLPLAAVRF